MIKKGDKGTEVQWLQEGLKGLGFEIVVDGDFVNASCNPKENDLCGG